MILRSSAVYFGASLPALGEITFRVFALEHHGEIAGVEFARRDFGRADVGRRFDRGDANDHVLRGTDLRAGTSMCPDRLHRKAVSQRDMVANLVLLALRQLEARRIDAEAVAEMNEPRAFVDGEEYASRDRSAAPAT